MDLNRACGGLLVFAMLAKVILGFWPGDIYKGF